jgi:hypothetical protein
MNGARGAGGIDKPVGPRETRPTEPTGAGQVGGILEMDRDDAAFVANVLECRIASARVDLERLAASSFAALLAAAAIIRENSESWTPGIQAADELSAIAKRGAAVCDDPVPEHLQTFVDSMRKLADERPTLNRAARRKLIAVQPRARRGIRASELVVPPAMRIN